MNGKTLKIALAVSVALNLFGLAAAGAFAVTRERVEERVEAQQRPTRPGSTMSMIDRLSPEVQPEVRQTLRAGALSARPDFEESREKRRQAIALAASPTFDADRVTALLNESRAAELRGRQRLEATAVAMLAELDPADRAIMSDILKRKRHGGKDRDRSRSDKTAASTTP